MIATPKPIIRGSDPDGRVAAQHRLILKYLAEGRKLSNMDAINVLGISSLTKRVSELRRRGHPILSEWRRDPFQVRYKVYFFNEENAQVYRDNFPA